MRESSGGRLSVGREKRKGKRHRPGVSCAPRARFCDSRSMRARLRVSLSSTVWKSDGAGVASSGRAGVYPNKPILSSITESNSLTELLPTEFVGYRLTMAKKIKIRQHWHVGAPAVGVPCPNNRLTLPLLLGCKDAVRTVIGVRAASPTLLCLEVSV